MRTLLRPSAGQIDRGRWFIWLVGILIVIGSALLIGRLIGQENWLLLGFATVMILALRWPIEVAFGLYALLVPFNSITTLGGANAGTTANYALGAIAGTALLVTGVVRKRLSRPPLATLWWPLFLIWGALTTTWALRPQLSIHQLPTAIALVLLYLVGVSWRLTDKEFSILRGLITTGGCLAACYVVYQFTIGVNYIGEFGATGRATMVGGGMEANPNNIGIDLLLPFSLAVAWFVSARRWLTTTLGLGAVGIIAYAIFLTMSRSSLLGIALILAIYLLRVGLNRRVLMIPLALLLVALTMPGTFFSRIQGAVATGGAGRLDIWHAGVVVLKRYWLTGAGLGNFPVAFNDYAGYQPVFQGFDRGSHNTYLNVGVELGVVGILLMCAALIAQFRSVKRLRSMPRLPIWLIGLESACWAMLVQAFFGDILWIKSLWLCWILFFMALRVGEDSLAAAKAKSPSSSGMQDEIVQEWTAFSRQHESNHSTTDRQGRAFQP